MDEKDVLTQDLKRFQEKAQSPVDSFLYALKSSETKGAATILAAVTISNIPA